MVKLIFYGGVNEIGGNKILLEDKDVKIFLDFGMGFSRKGKYFEEYLTPRTANGIGDFLEIGLIPNIHGIYREDLLEHIGRKAEEPEILGVILSHAHADHSNYVSFLHKDIPIYCGETCKYVLDAVNEQRKRTLESEVVDFRPRPIYKRDRARPPIKRKFEQFRTGDKIKIDSLEIEPIHVDHSVPGAYGIIVHTSEGSVVYTGDLRLHGPGGNKTIDFLRKAEDSKPLALVTEGTRIDSAKVNESEKKVYEESKSELLKCNNFSIVDFNFKDVSRFKTFYNISQEIGKKLVINFRHACFLDHYYKDKKLQMPNCKGEDILLLKPKRLTGTYIEEDYSDKYIKKRLHYPNIITAEDIIKKPQDYIIVLNFWYFHTLIDLKPKSGIYIHSLSEPFNEETELSFKRMMNWLEYFNLKFVQSHCSGHISKMDLQKLICEINPKKIFPIHTDHPNLFKKLSNKIQIIKENKPYIL